MTIYCTTYRIALVPGQFTGESIERAITRTDLRQLMRQHRIIINHLFPKLLTNDVPDNIYIV